jgi:6-pyruvoyltetrahydropterin/6-carboxytetrahydropterin synthase
VPDIRLTREVRFSIDRDWVRAAHGAEGFVRALPVTNSWAGWPSAVGIAPYLVLRATLRGAPDPVTGYLVNIRRIDAMLREHAIPLAARRLAREGVGASGAGLIREIWRAAAAVAPPPARLAALELRTTPHLGFAVREEEIDMIEMTQSFEFSAAHRLHVAALSDARNRELFGKCNNPNGHGHNYLLEVGVTGALDSAGGFILPLPRFEAIVQQRVIDRFDHTHLNLDAPDFAGLNPSVENIARVIWGLLHDQMSPARLSRVRVWETPKTCAEYRGD